MCRHFSASVLAGGFLHKQASDAHVAGRISASALACLKLATPQQHLPKDSTDRKMSAPNHCTKLLTLLGHLVGCPRHSPLGSTWRLGWQWGAWGVPPLATEVELPVPPLLIAKLPAGPEECLNIDCIYT